MCSGRSIEGLGPWPAGAVYAVNDMIVSGGGVSITESKASRAGGSGGVARFLGPGCSPRLPASASLPDRKQALAEMLVL